MKRCIRVLTVFNEIGWGGDESRLLSMAVGIDRSRFEHFVLTLLDHNSELAHAGLRERGQQYARSGITVTSLSREEPDTGVTTGNSAGVLQRKMAVLRRARRLARVVKRWNIDVIDARTAAYFVGALAGKMTATPTVVTLYHGIRDGDAVSWPRAIRLSLYLADCVLTDSQVRAAEFRAQLYLGKRKVTVIPNGIPRPESAYDHRNARKALGLPEDLRIRVIGQVGRFIDFKGQKVLLRAAPKILARYPDAAFLMVGYTEHEDYRQELRGLAGELGITDRVRMISYPGSIGDVWRAIDIHVHPSVFDSLPVAIIEGMSWGKPAVVTSAGGIPEMVEHGRTGLVVPPGDSAALAEATLQLLENQELACRLGEAAQQRYEHRYRPETMISALEELFLRMAKQPGLGASS